MRNKKLGVLGIMSGSSLDGVDLALFTIDTSSYPDIDWDCLKTSTADYPEAIKQGLSDLASVNAVEYFAIENAYTDFLIEEILDFLSDNVPCDLIGLHGHTFLHQPEQGYSIQLGNGGKISEKVNIPCITDFRNQDIARGGEGAPMAPLVDHLLFSEYNAWINLGGIVNITTDDAAYDIGPFNQVINFLAQQAGYTYDRDGNIGSTGTYHEKIAYFFQAFPFYKLAIPRSLSNDKISDYFQPFLIDSQLDIPDLLHTFYKHIAGEISEHLEGISSCLVTGGGAHNKYFIKLLREYAPNTDIVLPDKNLIDFKESLLIALAAQLRYIGRPNYLKGMTRARDLVSAGAVYMNAPNGNK